MKTINPYHPQKVIGALVDTDKFSDNSLHNLVSNTQIDPGAPFSPIVVSALSGLKNEDRPAFESLRAELKKAGCRVSSLDELISKTSMPQHKERNAQTETLLKLIEYADLFHTLDGIAFADIDVEGHRETWAIRSPGFRRWITQKYYMDTQGAPSSTSLQSALSATEAKALFDGPVRNVHLRVGSLDGRLYLDLCDAKWRVIEIDSSGWRVIADPPIRFRRTPGMRSLPVPVAGGSIAALRNFLNVQSNDDFVLVVSWALA